MTERNEERVDFIAATIHELKAFLTAIIVSAELLADELQPDEKSVLGRLIQSIIRNAHSLDERLYLLSEIGGLLAENSRFQPEPVDIRQVIHDIAAQFYPRIQRRKQSLTLELPNSLPPAKADRRYLEQIVLTLIANASEFTAEEGGIKVSACQDGENLVIQVTDTGVGIPVEEQERIFQPYYQIKQDKEGKQAGSGLGLAIIKFRIKQHGGRIWVQSEPGKGSTFTFILPIERGES